jgi:hypothetical protein
MKSLTIFVFACILVHMFATCTERSTFLKKDKEHHHEHKQLKRLALRRQDAPLNNSTNSTDDIPEDKVYQGNCFMKMHNWFYNLYKITEKDKNIIIKSKGGKMIDFNLCHNVKTVCTDKKGLIVDKEECVLYAGKKSHDKVWTLTGKNNN